MTEPTGHMWIEKVQDGIVCTLVGGNIVAVSYELMPDLVQYCPFELEIFENDRARSRYIVRVHPEKQR